VTKQKIKWNKEKTTIFLCSKQTLLKVGQKLSLCLYYMSCMSCVFVISLCMQPSPCGVSNWRIDVEAAIAMVNVEWWMANGGW